MSIRFCAVAAALVVSAPALGLGTIIQPVSATTNMGQFSAGYAPTFAIDQSGLSANYVSGVTDFTSFISSTSTVNGGSSFNTWYSAPGNFTGTFDFVLPGAYMIDSIVLWNDPQTANQGVNQVRLYGDDNAAFSSPTLLITMNFTDGTPNAANFGQWGLFSPDANPVSHMRMEIVSHHGSTLTTGFVEAAFGYGILPTPGVLALLAPGALLAVRRRR